MFEGLTFDLAKQDSVAQPVEQYTFNVWVLGSNPSRITKSLLIKGAFLLNSPKYQDF
jgi:hypothetical protein